MKTKSKGLLGGNLKRLAKVAVPFVALLGNGAFASSRSNSGSRFVRKNSAVVVSDNNQTHVPPVSYTHLTLPTTPYV